MPYRVEGSMGCAVLAMLLIAGPVGAEPTTCQRSVLKESIKYAQKALKELGKCEDRVIKGKLPALTDCTADPVIAFKIAKAETKLRAAMGKKCGGSDRSCGTGGDDDSLASIGWPGTCPDFETLGCTNSIGDCDDIGECLFCVNDAAVNETRATIFDDLLPSSPSADKALNKCQRTLGKETIKHHKTVTKTLQKCWDKRLKGSHANPCPDPGDGSAVAKLAKAESKRSIKICKACGGDDKLCGTNGDLSPNAIGFAPLCPSVGDCQRVISTVADINECLGCVAAFRAECETALAVPALAPYPPTCATPPPPPVCGDGVVELIEECDDGGTSGGDGCSATCELEDASALCAGVPSTSGTSIASTLVASGLSSPVHITAPRLDPNRLFIVEQTGAIRIVKHGSLLPTPFLDLAGMVSDASEQGLLSLAFHPDYESNGRFFVNYTDLGGDTVIARYDVSADPDIADAASALILFTVDQPFSNHNGGLNAFGPDGYLYVGMGDGGSGNDPLEAGQDDSTILGKMLRIDVDVVASPFYGAPADNPDPNAPDPLNLIWAKGVRNPWRFSFDRATDEMYIADVGQNAREEINIQPAATASENYGWDIFEGRSCFEPGPLCSACPSPVCPGSPVFNIPVLEYDHVAGCSITGGFVYRGCALPDIHGTYFYGDFCTDFIRSFNGVSGGDAQNLLDHTAALDPPGGLSIDSITSFGEDARGELYIADQNGEVFKIIPGP